MLSFMVEGFLDLLQGLEFRLCLICSYFIRLYGVFSEGPTKSGVEDYEAMDVEQEDMGPGPQRCKAPCDQIITQ